MLQVMEIDHGSLLDSIACCPGSMYWTKLYKTDAWWCVQQGRAQGQQVGKQTPMAVSSWRNRAAGAGPCLIVMCKAAMGIQGASDRRWYIHARPLV